MIIGFQRGHNRLDERELPTFSEKVMLNFIAIQSQIPLHSTRPYHPPH
jgi:hypothetical protein